MAIVKWKVQQNGATITFRPDVDEFRFDDAAISAGSVAVGITPTTLVFTFGGKTVTLAMNPLAATNSHIVFENGSVLRIGDNSTGTVNDDAANSLTGSPGNDQLIGRGGNDTLNGGPGADRLIGGTGNDTYVVSSALDVVTETRKEGADLVQSTAAAHTLAANVENLTLLTGGIHGTGNAGSNIITGNTGNNTLNGGDGNDTLNGGAGNDALNGGAGKDTASYAGSTAGVTVSLAVTTAQDTVGAGTDTLNSIEHLTGSDFTDMLTGNGHANTLSGGGSNDTLQGKRGDDTLDGGAGNDTLSGGSGSDRASYAATATGVTVDLTVNSAQNTVGAGTDTLISIERLTGSAFNDTLIGGAGDNILKGLAGADVLTGGVGADRFDFDAVGDSFGNTGATRDTISDFNETELDKIDVSIIDANGSGAGNGKFTFVAAFSANATGQLRFDATTHQVLGSIDADSAAEFSVLLSGVSSMTGGNFIL